MKILRDIHRGFTGPWRPSRVERAIWSIAVATVLLGVKGGCGVSPGSATPMVKDPPPLAPEETTEALFQAKAKVKPAAKARRR